MHAELAPVCDALLEKQLPEAPPVVLLEQPTATTVATVNATTNMTFFIWIDLPHGPLRAAARRRSNGTWYGSGRGRLA